MMRRLSNIVRQFSRDEGAQYRGHFLVSVGVSAVGQRLLRSAVTGVRSHPNKTFSFPYYQGRMA